MALIGNMALLVNMSGMVVGNTAPVANSEKGLELPGFAEAKKK